MSWPLVILEKIGGSVIAFFEVIGRVAIFVCRSLVLGFTTPFYWRQVAKQTLVIGFYSLPVVGLTAIFTGMAMAVQCYSGFSQYAAENAVPNVVMIAMLRELGPVLTALMIAGRLGASMTAEIGTMKVTEQIDAMTTLAVNPYKYLVFPRIICGIMLLPFLIIVDDVVGIFGGYLICVYKYGFNASNYVYQTLNNMQAFDVISGLVKGSCFGFIVCLMGCYNGFISKGGAEGVGRATTNSVVASSILILLFNYILTMVMF